MSVEQRCVLVVTVVAEAIAADTHHRSLARTTALLKQAPVAAG